MLNGLNEKLEQALVGFADEKDNTGWADVMTVITDSVAAGDLWRVPVDLVPDGTNETDYEDGHVLSKLPAFVKKTISNDRDETWFCAFTSPEKVTLDSSSEPIMTVSYPARDLLEEFATCESGDGFVINPWSDDFKLDRETAKKVLELAQKVPEERIRAQQTYRLEPKAVIDTNDILAEWMSGWEDDNKQEKWELQAYPIMADGRILLLFEMKDEVYTGKYDSFHAAHTITHYRVLEYRLGDNGPEQIGKYRFKTQDSHVATVYLYDGKLNAAISPEGSESWSILPMVPTNDDGQFTIYGNVRTMIVNSNGEVIVGYERNLLDESSLPLMVFSESGEAVKRYHDEHVLACSELNLDAEENIWFHLYPSKTVDVVNVQNDCLESHAVALQGFDGMAVSTDRSKLFVEFDEHKGGSLFYVMTREENGGYGKPVRFEFFPELKDGKRKKVSDYDVYGRGSTMKSWVLLNADGKLYLYDIDDC